MTITFSLSLSPRIIRSLCLVFFCVLAIVDVADLRLSISAQWEQKHNSALKCVHFNSTYTHTRTHSADLKNDRLDRSFYVIVIYVFVVSFHHIPSEHSVRAQTFCTSAVNSDFGNIPTSQIVWMNKQATTITGLTSIATVKATTTTTTIPLPPTRNTE